MVGDEHFATLGLHACRTCNSPAATFLHDWNLTTHLKCHIVTRHKTNHSIITDTYRHATPSTWATALRWVHNTPPPPNHATSPKTSGRPSPPA
jgi:hypothetical protein